LNDIDRVASNAVGKKLWLSIWDWRPDIAPIGAPGGREDRLPGRPQTCIAHSDTNIGSIEAVKKPNYMSRRALRVLQFTGPNSCFSWRFFKNFLDPRPDFDVVGRYRIWWVAARSRIPNPSPTSARCLLQSQRFGDYATLCSE
jgi:hypothetical protein